MGSKIESEVKRIVSKIIEIPGKNIDLNADLFNNLGIDSLTALEIITEIEKRYKVVMKAEDVANIRTLAQLIELLHPIEKK